ncbi:MAG TPA: hypothetical protein VH079_00030 [Terriglobales bacterium]|nr:hypothetical protein [Terriglobales bacterium]
MRMIWWFLALALGAGAALWASISVFIRVRSHMKASDGAMSDTDPKA